MENGPDRLADSFQNRDLDILFDHDNQAAKILDHNGKEIPTVIAFWFAWYAFHPDTLVQSHDPIRKTTHSEFGATRL